MTSICHVSSSYRHLVFPVSAKDRDLQAITLRLLSGTSVTPGNQAQFELTFNLIGLAIPGLHTAPWAVPFHLAFYLSDDEKLSSNDIDLRYQPSNYVSRLLSEGVNEGQILLKDKRGKFKADIDFSRCTFPFPPPSCQS